MMQIFLMLVKLGCVISEYISLFVCNGINVLNAFNKITPIPIKQNFYQS